MKIAIIGKGNVGTHIHTAFIGKGINVALLDSRTMDGISPDFDFILISVADQAIGEVAQRLSTLLPKGYRGIVAHTGGSVVMETLKPFFSHYGVFYPLQTFNKEVHIENYAEIPLFVEGCSDEVTDALHCLALTVSPNVYELDSEKRCRLHLAAVFASNFVNALFMASEELTFADGLPFNVMHPLIKKTMAKVLDNSPSASQTGPARRRDHITIAKHIDMLNGNHSLQDIYKIISEYIINKYQ